MPKLFQMLALIAALSWSAASAQGPGNVLLVVNDSSEDSKTIGRYYAAKRSLPPDRICSISTDPGETISRQAYDREIRDAVAACLRRNQLQDQILYLVTTKGVPLLIEGDAGPVGDLASVDSELALLYRFLAYGRYTAYGRVENPYFAVRTDVANPQPFTRREHDIYLVTRLTGYSAVDVIFLIDRSAAPEAGGRFVFDLPSRRQSVESGWVSEAVSQLRSQGFDVQLESTAAALELSEPIIGFCSWGGADAGFRLPEAMQWKPGAIALSFDPTSARTFRRSEGALGSSGDMAAQFVARGAVGFGGQVSDPTADGQIRPQIVFPSYAAGLNLAESFYRAIPYLSWRAVVVGDPLTMPFGEKTKGLRRRTAAEFQTPMDSETGLPVHFSRRRGLYLKRKHQTADETVSLLLRAEGLLHQAGRRSEAIALLERSLQLDPLILETHELLGDALEQDGQFDRAFDQYSNALELDKSSKSLRVKLADIAQGRLLEPEKAAPHAEWLFARYGSSEPRFVQRWADLNLALGKPETAESLYLRLLDALESPPPAALAALGRIYHSRQKWELAERYLGEALAQIAASKPAAASNGQGELEALHREAAQRMKETSPETGAEPAEPGPQEAVRPARVAARTSPLYPQRAQQAGIQGVVVLRLLIDENGQLLKIKHVYGHDWLSEAFQEAVKQWRFEPRLVRGRPEPSWLPVSIRFRLTKE